MKTFIGINDQSLSPWKYSLLLDKKGMIVDLSKSAAKELGYRDSELQNSYIYSIIPFLATSLYGRLWNIQHSAIDIFSFEAVERKKCGDVSSVTIHMRFIEIRGITHILCSVESSNTLEPTRQENEDPLPESNPDPCFIANITQDGRYAYVYGKIQNLCGITNLEEVPNFFGYTPAELLGKSIASIIDEAYQQKFIEGYYSLASNHIAFRMRDICAMSKNGSAIQFDAYFMPRRNDSGSFLGYSMTHWKKES